jgi:hypothetical protein
MADTGRSPIPAKHREKIMRNLNEIELNVIAGGGDMAPDDLPPDMPPNQDVAAFVRMWNALHPHNPLPVSD